MRYQDDFPLWHQRDQRHEDALCLERVFRRHREAVDAVVAYAGELREKIEALSPFIQDHTALICPSCPEVCCINVHGYYERNDLIYLYALGGTPPRYRRGVHDTDPCQFLSRSGCFLERAIRPFRCNWYFCGELTRHMEDGPARPYRSFIRRLQEVVDLRTKMLEEFSCRMDALTLRQPDWHAGK